MKTKQICTICKEHIEIVNDNEAMSILEHLSAIHGIVVQPSEKSDDPLEKVADDQLTEHLKEIQFSKVNN